MWWMVGLIVLAALVLASVLVGFVFRRPIAEAKSALEGTDIAAIKSAMEKLGTESQALGQAIYEATQAEQAAGGAGAGADSPVDDNVVDAEVVEDDQENK